MNAPAVICRTESRLPCSSYKYLTPSMVQTPKRQTKMISRCSGLLKRSFLSPGTSALGLPMVRWDSRHPPHSWTLPNLAGKVLVIAPDSHTGLADFHPISASSAFKAFQLACCGVQ